MLILELKGLKVISTLNGQLSAANDSSDRVKFSAGSAIVASFLSQLDCDSYYTSKERFTGGLTAYTRKLFF